MRFTINLATKTYINHLLVNRAIWGTVIMLLLLLVWNSNRLLTATGTLNRLKADIAGYEVQLNARPAGVPEVEYARMQNSIRFYNGIINRKTSDWLGLLDKLEQVTPQGIALSSLAVDPKNKEIKLEGMAKSFTDVRAYLDSLEESKFFNDSRLISHQDTATSEKANGVKFAIICRMVLQ